MSLPTEFHMAVQSIAQKRGEAIERVLQAAIGSGEDVVMWDESEVAADAFNLRLRFGRVRPGEVPQGPCVIFKTSEVP